MKFTYVKFLANKINKNRQKTDLRNKNKIKIKKERLEREMENKGKKIIAGMMAGFSVLSTQSVLTSFQKLPMGGG